MKKSFGEESVEDAKMVKYTLIIFSASYALRITEDILLSVYYDRVNDYSAEWVAGLRLASWFLWDLVPIICLYVIHFDNFSSYQNEEILYCEYTDDGRSSANSYADLLFGTQSGEKEEDSLFKRTLPGASSSQFNSQLELSSDSDDDAATPYATNPSVYTSSKKLRKLKTSR